MKFLQPNIEKLSEHMNTKPTADYVSSSPERPKYFSQCVPLHRAALRGDWETAKVLLSDYPSLLTTPITGGGETVLHLAAVEGHNHFVSNLLDLMDETDLEIQNAKGSTALCFAAAAGQIGTAKRMMKKNVNLAKIRGENGITPLYMAALQGYEEMAEYLYPLSDFEAWTPEHQIALLTTCVDSEFYGLAMMIVNKYKILAIAEDGNGETPLQVLARKPLTSSCRNGQGIWSNINVLNTIFPYKKLMPHSKNALGDYHKLLDCLSDNVIGPYNNEIDRNGSVSKSLFLAAEYGNHDFLVKVINRSRKLLYKMNESKHSIFHIAVLNRQVKVFNLMLDLRVVKDLIATYIDKDGNNMLHLAGKRAPTNKLASIPGAVLQMQREVLWYKEVEKLVKPSYRNMKNSAGQIPYEVFLGDHEKLMIEGEKQMKQTAKSCILVTMLIASMIFSLAFTFPRGYDDNNTSAPILENKRLFKVFLAGEAVAMLSSLTSTLMFLLILKSRYSDDDFLKSLPFWLVIGVTLLFVSILTTMVLFYFCTCLLFFQHGWAITAVLLVFFMCVPVMFVVLKYPLLVTILHYTYSCRWLFRPDNRLNV